MIDKIFSEILEERKRQDNKWGIQNHRPIEWIAILSEEVGEAAKEALDHYFQNPPKGKIYEGDTMEEVQQMRLISYRGELIQTAAVVVQMIECLDRNELTPTGTR